MQQSFSYLVKSELAKNKIKSKEERKIFAAFCLLFFEYDVSGVVFFKTNHQDFYLTMLSIIEKDWEIAVVDQTEILHSSYSFYIPKSDAFLQDFMKEKLDFSITKDSFVFSTPEKIQPYTRLFLRAIFLLAGSVSDPEKSYKIEIIFKKKRQVELFEYCLNLESMQFSSIMRDNKYVMYLKDSQKITDFLGIIGAHIAYLKFENYRVEKSLINQVNRQMNCDQANTNRVITASLRQIQTIQKLMEKNLITMLPEPLQEIAKLRVMYPSLSIQELCEKSTENIGKSGMYHRLKKIENFMQAWEKKHDI